MKYTLCITQQCNLSCQYCYIGKKKAVMPLQVAERVIDFIFENSPPGEKIDIGFFGGEPLLEFELVRKITDMIESHPSFSPEYIELTVVTNGTIFSEQIAEYLKSHNIVFGISCDGPPFVQDTFRRFSNGKGSSSIVEKTIRQARKVLPKVLVNSVYHPKTFQYLPKVVEYLSSLGLRQIYLNPDFSAPWTKKEADLLSEIYSQIAEQYINFYYKGEPHFISLIDSKIAVILRGGYKPLERCRMGKGEFAFAPSGNIYPCERLIGSDDGEEHCIGNINSRFIPENSCDKIAPNSNIECQTCGLKDYCMNWCGCSNYFLSGYYNKVGPFLCASERTLISAAFHSFRVLQENLGVTFSEHLSGIPSLISAERLT